MANCGTASSEARDLLNPLIENFDGSLRGILGSTDQIRLEDMPTVVKDRPELS